ncbi:MAG: hypothetical protein HQK51_01325 [Oligoflexia bacterium]|nr:hypothetical protein [Oligoflexia bacterium]
MKRNLILCSKLTLSLTLVLTLILSYSLFTSANDANATIDPYSQCLQEAFNKHDHSKQLENDRFFNDLKFCYKFPFESSRYNNCYAETEKRHQENLFDITRELNLDKKACFEFME